MANLPDFHDERGQALSEYGLLLGLLALACLAAVTATGTSVQAFLAKTAGLL